MDANTDATGDLLRINDYDTLKLKAAKLTVNCDRLKGGRMTKERRKSQKVMLQALVETMQSAAANPLYRHAIISERLCVGARWEATQEQLEEMYKIPVDSKEFWNLAEKYAGDNFQLIIQAFKSWGVWHSDPTLDETNCFIFTHCNEHRSSRLCALAHAEFVHEIRTGKVLVWREQMSFQFERFMHAEDAARYIERVERRRQQGKQR